MATTNQAPREPVDERVARLVFGAVAALLILLAVRLPVWEARLDVLQYPGRQLALTAYANHLTGDVSEIKILNHYVGLRIFDMADLRETILWLPGIVVALACVAATVIFPRRRPGGPAPRHSRIGTLARIGLWVFPLGVLADIQIRLYELGHSMNPGAAFRQPPFTPPVIGKAQVSSNVHTTSWPGRAVVFLVVAAFLATFAMSLYRFAKQMLGVGAAATVLAVLLLVGAPGAPGAAAVAQVSVPVNLQALIDAAAPGARIDLPAGTYAGPVVIRQPLTLIGRSGVVIDGAGSGSVVTIAAPDVELAGLLLRHSGRDMVGAPSGVLITKAGSRAYVHDVSIRASYLGVTVQRAEDVRLVRVDIVGTGIISGELHAVGDSGRGAGDGSGDQAVLRGDGIWLYDAPRPSVIDCRIDTVRDGVYIAYGSDTLVQGTTITNSRYAVHAMYAQHATVRDSALRANLSGVVLMYGGPFLLQRDTITQSGSPSTGFGMLVKDVGDVTVEASVIADNRVGLHIDDAGRTGGAPAMIRDNTIAMNQVGVLLVPSADATFTGNGFIENSTQVTLAGTGGTQAVWSFQGVGNYWSDYAGFDVGGDGTGDLPYTRSGRTSQLIAEDPVLLALASGPAFRLLTSVEDKWTSGPPLVRDDRPMMRASSPPVSSDRSGPVIPLWVPGLLLTLGCGRLLVRGRRRGPRPIPRLEVRHA